MKTIILHQIMNRRLASLAVAALLAGCSVVPLRQGQGDTGTLPYMRSQSALQALNTTGAGKIQHIVYIVQENRSFDNLFHGYPGADTVSSGKDSKGKTIQLRPYPLGHPYEIDHSVQAMFNACDGTGTLQGTDCKMDGFDKEFSFGGPKHSEYVYAPYKQVKPYWDMAHEWVVADRMFQSQLDESFVAHQYVIAAQADFSADLPIGKWGCGGGKSDVLDTITKERTIVPRSIHPCFDYQTLGDELDKAKLTWRFYSSKYGSNSSDGGTEWSGYQAVKHIRYGPDWKNVIAPNWQFILDVRKGQLANFTWITPVCDDSDHVNCPGTFGPSWVSALVNTVGQSKFWDSTVIFVQWDDWGGLYDHVPPPYEGRDGLGFRVPLLIISPYARQRVTHVQYETASVLRFAENLFGLGQLADADRRANAPGGDSFDFSRKPRPFVKIEAPHPPKFFMHPFPDDYFAPDYE
jgi:phospholipase C